MGSLALMGLAVGGCTREPLPCQLELDEGDLVITEIRGPQEGADTRGEWFEIFNATDETLDLRGLRGELVNLKGSIELGFLVRESLTVEPGGYVVLGSLRDPPPEVDYSFFDDFAVAPQSLEVDYGQITGGLDEGGAPSTPFDYPLPPLGEFVEDQLSDPKELFANARIELWACDQRIDALVYAELPTLGTYSFDGIVPPDADGNDDALQWCTNETEAPATGPQTELGLPGSPGEANPPCP